MIPQIQAHPSTYIWDPPAASDDILTEDLQPILTEDMKPITQEPK